jgi:hypothetical protein
MFFTVSSLAIFIKYKDFINSLSISRNSLFKFKTFYNFLTSKNDTPLVKKCKTDLLKKLHDNIEKSIGVSTLNSEIIAGYILYDVKEIQQNLHELKNKTATLLEKYDNPKITDEDFKESYDEFHAKISDEDFKESYDEFHELFLSILKKHKLLIDKHCEKHCEKHSDSKIFEDFIKLVEVKGQITKDGKIIVDIDTSKLTSTKELSELKPKYLPNFMQKLVLLILLFTFIMGSLNEVFEVILTFKNNILLLFYYLVQTIPAQLF